MRFVISVFFRQTANPGLNKHGYIAFQIFVNIRGNIQLFFHWHRLKKGFIVVSWVFCLLSGCYYEVINSDSLVFFLIVPVKALMNFHSKACKTGINDTGEDMDRNWPVSGINGTSEAWCHGISDTGNASHVGVIDTAFWYRTYLIRNLFDTNLFDKELIWYRTYLIQNLFNTELIWYGTY
jgi:hypothetical protein